MIDRERDREHSFMSIKNEEEERDIQGTHP